MHHLGSLSHDRRLAGAQAFLLILAKSTFPFFFLQKNSMLAKEVRELTIINLLSLSWGFEATDARDKIFAVVGLQRADSSDRLSFKPDYSVNTRQMFLQTAKHFLQSSQSLAILMARPAKPFSSRNSRAKDINELPTWAEDWTSPQLWSLGSIWVCGFSEFYTLNMYMPKSGESRHQHLHQNRTRLMRWPATKLIPSVFRYTMQVSSRNLLFPLSSPPGTRVCTSME